MGWRKENLRESSYGRRKFLGKVHLGGGKFGVVLGCVENNGKSRYSFFDSYFNSLHVFD